ncbi:hypothetical protein C8R47DRAFT_487180 [Mycena vitilis]|nr:hypothetical protein C8R47DRAFT_487180 [Mycena vitilis]
MRLGSLFNAVRCFAAALFFYLAFCAFDHNHQALASMPRVKKAKNANTSLGQQLQDIFDIEKATLKKMKAQYRDLAVTYLDGSKTLSGQPGGSTEALKRIGEGVGDSRSSISSCNQEFSKVGTEIPRIPRLWCRRHKT